MDIKRFDSLSSQQVDSAKCEALLWEKAGEISESIQRVQAEVGALYSELQTLHKQGSTVGNDDEYKLKDKRYWEAVNEIDDLKHKENRLQALIEKIAEGTVAAEELVEFVSEEELNGPQLSKRRRRMLEDARKMQGRGDGYTTDERFLVNKGPAPTTRLTTGRHAGAVKGAQLSSFDAEAVFTHSTTDTHGGKVGYGKKSGSYVGASGKRVRKK